MMNTQTLQNLEVIEKAISKAPAEKQRRFLARLPHLLRIDSRDFGLLKLAESSFEFWNNPDDAIYDTL
jgi:hypothetical protein